VLSAAGNEIASGFEQHPLLLLLLLLLRFSGCGSGGGCASGAQVGVAAGAGGATQHTQHHVLSAAGNEIASCWCALAAVGAEVGAPVGAQVGVAAGADVSDRLCIVILKGKTGRSYKSRFCKRAHITCAA
jgi:hypothetical protein